LARYPSALVLCIDHVVQCGVCVRLGGLGGLEREGRDRFEGCIGFAKPLLLKMRQGRKAELQRLLHRYLP